MAFKAVRVGIGAALPRSCMPLGNGMHAAYDMAHLGLSCCAPALPAGSARQNEAASGAPASKVVRVRLAWTRMSDGHARMHPGRPRTCSSSASGRQLSSTERMPSGVSRLRRLKALRSRMDTLPCIDALLLPTELGNMGGVGQQLASASWCGSCLQGELSVLNGTLSSAKRSSNTPSSGPSATASSGSHQGRDSFTALTSGMAFTECRLPSTRAASHFSFTHPSSHKQRVRTPAQSYHCADAAAGLQLSTRAQCMQEQQQGTQDPACIETLSPSLVS